MDFGKQRGVQRTPLSICLKNGPGICQPADGLRHPCADRWVGIMAEGNSSLYQRGFIENVWLKMDAIDAAGFQEIYDGLGWIFRVIHQSIHCGKFFGELLNLGL